MPVINPAKLFVTACAALALLPAVALAADDSAESAPCENHGKHHGDIAGHQDMRAQLEAELATLGLSDTQKQDIGTLVQLYGERLQAIAARGDENRRELLELSPLDPDYDTLTNEVSQEASAAAGEVVNVLSELQRTAFLLLSNEQQDTLLQLRAEKQQAMQERIAAKRAERAARGPAVLP